MAYDESLARRVRAQLADQSDLAERKMFGGLAFMLRGNMCCGIVGDELMVRVGPNQYNFALGQPHAREMHFTGRPMKGMVMVAVPGLETDRDLAEWVQRGVQFTTTLPAK